MKFWKNKNIILARNLEAGDLMEIAVVAAITSVLALRAFLAITGYPQISGGDFHIAHTLFGGLMLSVSLYLVLVYLNPFIKKIAAVVGGVGFGMFIDELGKFITKDNNYFFRPTSAIIYLVFVGLFFLVRYLDKHILPSKEERILNALQIIENGTINGIEEKDRQRLFYLLANEKDEKIIGNLKNLIDNIFTVQAKTGLYSKSKTKFRAFYKKLTYESWFLSAIVFWCTIFIFAGLLKSVWGLAGEVHFSGLMQLFFWAMSSLFALLGIKKLMKSERVRAFWYFKQALIVNIFFTQVFAFAIEQFSAVWGLLVGLFLLLGINFMITQEQEPEKP